MGNEFSWSGDGPMLGNAPSPIHFVAYTLQNDESPNPRQPGIFSCRPGTTETIFGFIALEAGLPVTGKLRAAIIVDSPATNGAAQGEELSSTDTKSPPGGQPGRQPGRTSAGAKAAGKSGGADHGSAAEQEMGAALRSVYQRAVDEKVPDDLMDLLGKLG